ncbi:MULTISPECIES: hypothetical protein [Mycobacterium]|uniref:ABC transporter substrate-binding protein n=1 Tax=Mycobacterium kiyosense TaxID=2871094 RepID=A0A9P3Q5Z8_9MYCO|nr:MULTISPECIES: hypothetical protein [Mycobacterium]BDB41302.1 hypothetical protein IWGMT90018_17480 [Mycobacterium kiyosense]BDE13057.1 hypothetical protein MKCMC460_19170 [Mycobacterium sp. 20KCMC460]GLB82015.1 hypothetical protein SRL2020028_12710 [Mycobacterium kiyosense]GLB89526.1 hypothetical protein SRL2020130_23430 [Mycobacterium kiyosense]GLB95157.1 hypothetical protein SRL2020226_19330 [Mycobacterium kiyosense]
MRAKKKVITAIAAAIFAAYALLATGCSKTMGGDAITPEVTAVPSG